jgi:hypothetical protein
MVSHADSTAVSRPPFPLDRPTSASWREQALSKVAELRFVRDWMLRSLPANAVDEKAKRTIDDHLQAAASAAKGGSIWKPRNFVAAVTGSAVERVVSQLDAVESELLRIAPSTYLRGEISSLLAHVQLISSRTIRGGPDSKHSPNALPATTSAAIRRRSPRTRSLRGGGEHCVALAALAARRSRARQPNGPR